MKKGESEFDFLHKISTLFDDDKIFPCTMEFNEKGRMDREEFKKYLFDGIVSLCPNSLDVPGKQVVIKIESGLDQNNNEIMYAQSRRPNATAVFLETY